MDPWNGAVVFVEVDSTGCGVDFWVDRAVGLFAALAFSCVDEFGVATCRWFIPLSLCTVRGDVLAGRFP